MPERSILAWLAIGLVVGVLGKFIMSDRDPGGWIATILIGLAGALLVGFVAETMHWTLSGAWQNYVAAAVGAIMGLSVYRWVRRRRIY